MNPKILQKKINQKRVFMQMNTKLIIYIRYLFGKKGYHNDTILWFDSSCKETVIDI